MGGKNKGSEPKRQTQKTTPFDAGRVRYGNIEAQRLYNQDRDAPPFAPFSDISQGVLNQAETVLPQATQQLQQTMQGDFLGANPYLQDLVGDASKNAMAGINATFGSAGRTGGGLHQGAIAEGLGDVAARIYAPAYETERNRQFGAASMVPGLLQGQLGIGRTVEAKDLEEQLAPYTALQRYANIVNMPAGGTTIQTAPGTEGRGALAGAAGGALTGASLFPANPLIGAGVGGVLGGFGVI